MVGKILWKRAWQPTPVFLPGESPGQRSLVGCSPWVHKESDVTEYTHTHTHTHTRKILKVGVRKMLYFCGLIFLVSADEWETSFSDTALAGVF